MPFSTVADLPPIHSINAMRRCNMDTPELSKVETTVKADVAEVKTDEAAAKSWLAANYHYALAIAIGALILGVSIGFKLGMHQHA